MNDGDELQCVERPAGVRLGGAVIGALVGFTEVGVPLVDFQDNPHDSPLPARATIAVGAGDAGREGVLVFEGDDPTRPILVGLLVEPKRWPELVTVQRDGERIELTADREIVLRCGDASITLTRAGKVLIRGAYVSSHSSGLNRIKGGAVQIN